jgi:signal transduction histidine kinase
MMDAPLSCVSDSFLPHGQCLAWRPGMLWLEAGSAAVIALACFALALALHHFSQRRADLAPRAMFGAFVILMAALGIAELAALVVMWTPQYPVEAAIKAATATIALFTAALAWRGMPRALAQPSPAALAAESADLRADLARATETEQELRRAHDELSQKLSHCKDELSQAGDQLRNEVLDRRRTEQSLRYTETLLRRLHEDLEDHIAERTAELTKTIAELEAFSYSVSHDLRQPLRAINGFAAILRDEHAARLDSEGDELLMKIETNAAKMAQLIDGLLDFSRLARAEQTSREVDMKSLAESVAAELRPQQSASAIAIRIGDLLPAIGDEAMLRQVWANLLSNALKFSSPKPEPTIEVGGEARDGELVYFVRDNGVGFDMNYVEKLFGVFNRLHRADEFPGVGVGLALTRRIVLRHGGRVWAEGRPGEGSTFYFALPGPPVVRRA